MVDILEIAFGFLSGLVVGYLSQYFVFKNNLKLEKLKRLSPHLELVFPVVDKLKKDSSYVNGIDINDDQTHHSSIMT